MVSPCNDTEDKSKGASCVSCDSMQILEYERRLDRFSFRHCFFLSFCLAPIFFCVEAGLLVPFFAFVLFRSL